MNDFTTLPAAAEAVTEVTLSAAETVTEAAPELFFEPANFLSNLQYMGIGMLVIFVIIGIIILSTMLINYLFSDTNS